MTGKKGEGQRILSGMTGARLALWAEAWLVLVSLAACASRPAPSASSPGDGPTCARRPLLFRPAPGVTYAFSVQESGTTPRTYAGELTMARGTTGWRATERGFAGAFAPESVGDLSAAALDWRLDEGGAPVAPPTERGAARPDVLQNLSLFAFRPTGLALPSTCAGAASVSRWTDAIGRVRTARFVVIDADSSTVRLHVEGDTQTAVNRWTTTGTIQVARSDGLSGVAELDVTGPGAPDVNVLHRRVRVAPRRP
jgi:hypothetical protein